MDDLLRFDGSMQAGRRSSLSSRRSGFECGGGALLSFTPFGFWSCSSWCRPLSCLCNLRGAGGCRRRRLLETGPSLQNAPTDATRGGLSPVQANSRREVNLSRSGREPVTEGGVVAGSPDVAAGLNTGLRASAPLETSGPARGGVGRPAPNGRAAPGDVRSGGRRGRGDPAERPARSKREVIHGRFLASKDGLALEALCCRSVDSRCGSLVGSRGTEHTSVSSASALGPARARLI